ncbi:MAG: polysaccharide lyase family 8 super-sandwich domain-containing protein [Flavobacterium sp.]
MKTKTTLFLIYLFLISSAIKAQITIDDSNYNWSRIENTNHVAPVFNDADNGDGLNDGAMVNNKSSTPVSLQGLQYSLSGSPTDGEIMNLEIKHYKYSSSYANFKMQVYNVTDNLVLAETAVTASSSTTAAMLSLSHTFTAASVGDQINVRFVRVELADSVVREAAFDYLKVNGQFVAMIEPCRAPFNFDIPLTTATQSEINDVAIVYNSLSDQILGTSVVSDTNLNNAITAYNALNISVIGTTITGNAITNISQVAFLKTFAQFLKSNPSNDIRRPDIIAKSSNVIWYVSSLNCYPNSNSNIIDFNGYSYPAFSRAAVFLGPYITDPTVRSLFGYSLYQATHSFEYLFGTDYSLVVTQNNNSAISTDVVHNNLDVVFAYTNWFDTDAEKIRYLKTAKRYLERFLSYNSFGVLDGLKPDGLSFHHLQSYDNYMYAFAVVSTVLKSLENTADFKLNQDSYLIFRDAVYAQTMYSNDASIKPFSLSGRNPSVRTTTLQSGTLSKTAISGGKILGLTTADPVLAGVYNRRFGVNAAFNYSTVTPFEEGYVQFNYGNLGVYRKNNWIATMKGQSNILPGAEIYATTNRFGRYQAYGTLEIIYPGNIDVGNGYNAIGWDWNYNPGTTTIILPWDKLHAEKENIDEKNSYGFAGALTLNQVNESVLSDTKGQTGLFAMKFKELNNPGWGTVIGPNTHNPTFEFTQTYFAIEDYIICLGSGIKNNDAINPTVTTLFQRLNNNANDILVNGVVKTSQPLESFLGTSANWIIDNYNTGYYVSPNSGTLTIRNSTQQTPYQDQVAPSPATIAGNATNDYHLAYLDHGTAPTNNSYEFVCIPSATPAQMTDFDLLMQTPAKPYTVHQNNINQQIIEHKASKTWAYALPAANATITDGLIKANDTPCLTMYKSINLDFTQILLSVSNPDMGASPSTPKVITLTLNNPWILSPANPNAAIVSVNATETVIQFSLADGLPVEVNLTIDPLLAVAQNNLANTIRVFPNPSADSFVLQLPNDNHQKAKIRILDTAGRVIKTLPKSNENTIKFGEDLRAGIYLLEVTMGDNRTVINVIKT